MSMNFTIAYFKVVATYYTCKFHNVLIWYNQFQYLQSFILSYLIVLSWSFMWFHTLMLALLMAELDFRLVVWLIQDSWSAWRHWTFLWNCRSSRKSVKLLNIFVFLLQDSWSLTTPSYVIKMPNCTAKNWILCDDF